MTQDKETLKLYILCRKKYNAFERKETESQEQWYVSKLFPWRKK